jgi:tRNA threonylcarbamoyladenosine biosynthesis protein TsaB
MLLAIDTATRTISLALHDGERVWAEQTWATRDHHTVELAPTVAAMLAHAGLAACQLEGVAVTLGPGSFTGLRIGMGFAKGLALACATPLIGVPTLDVLVAAQGHVLGRLCAVLQAGRGRVSVGFYGWGGGWQPEGQPFIARWEDVVESIGDVPTQVCGEIDRAGREALAGLGDTVEVARPADNLRRAGFLAELAWGRLHAGQSDDPASLAPIYLHEPEEPAGAT